MCFDVAIPTIILIMREETGMVMNFGLSCGEDDGTESYFVPTL